MANWKITAVVLAASAGMMLASPHASQGQAPQAQPPRPAMTFFVTSVGLGDGGNLGGLAGADRHCQELAGGAGGGKTWHAYLSTQASGNQPAVNARDRIGTGPWYNHDGYTVSANLGELHGDTLELARIGNRVTEANDLTEKGEQVHPDFDEPGSIHELLTGTQPDGTAYTDSVDHTCSNWTSDAAGMGSARVGHVDKNGHNASSWNSAVSTRGCSQQNVMAVGSAGLFYCFAIN